MDFLRETVDILKSLFVSTCSSSFVSDIFHSLSSHRVYPLDRAIGSVFLLNICLSLVVWLYPRGPLFPLESDVGMSHHCTHVMEAS